MFKRKNIDPFPDFPDVEKRTVTFFMRDNIKVSTEYTMPIQVLNWYIRNRKTLVIVPGDGGASMIVICSQVISILADSEIPEQ